MWFKRPRYGGGTSGSQDIWHKLTVSVRSGRDPHVSVCGYVYYPRYNDWKPPLHSADPAEASRCMKCARKVGLRG